MDYTVLRNEVQDDPYHKGYVQYIPDSPGMICEILNAKTETMIKQRFITARAVITELADATNILSHLKAAAPSNITLEVAWNFINTESGIDIGNAKAQQLCDGLVAMGVWTADQANAVKNMAAQPASRAEVLGLGVVTESDLRAAGVIP